MYGTGAAKLLQRSNLLAESVLFLVRFFMFGVIPDDTLTNFRYNFAGSESIARIRN